MSKCGYFRDFMITSGKYQNFFISMNEMTQILFLVLQQNPMLVLWDIAKFMTALVLLAYSIIIRTVPVFLFFLAAVLFFTDPDSLFVLLDPHSYTQSFIKAGIMLSGFILFWMVFIYLFVSGLPLFKSSIYQHIKDEIKRRYLMNNVEIDISAY